MGAYSHLYAMNQYLALGDYIVLSVNFRGGTGYGLHFREAEKFAEAGGSEVDDIAGAIAYLKGRADVDPDRLGVYGMSYGGVMTAMALGHFPDSFKAGVDIAGVHNWNSFLPYLSLPSTPQAVKDIAYRSSPIAKVADWRSPVLLIHGDNDRAVPFAQSIELIQGLRAAGHVEPDQLVFPDEVHDFIRHESWLSAFEASRRFLDAHLAAPAPAAAR
jgi:dipeptidyl aminopeptidase/acylaminoacyl peptidase